MEDTTEMFDNLIGCLNYVVILIIVCAAALAAVVLYNLISVNLGERKKELATIKVLGFFDNEVYRYIFREIDLLALIGSLVGLALVGAGLFTAIMLLSIGIMAWAFCVDPQDVPPLPLLVVLFGIPAGCIIGTLKVLVDRLKEIGKGEEDAYRNY